MKEVCGTASHSHSSHAQPLFPIFFFVFLFFLFSFFLHSYAVTNQNKKWSETPWALWRL